MVTLPNADHIACAIIAAAKQTADYDGPLADAADGCAKGQQGMHCRFYAYLILSEIFVEAKKAWLAKLVGASSYENYPYQRPKWFVLSTKQAARAEYQRLVAAHCIRVVPASPKPMASAPKPIEHKPNFATFGSSLISPDKRKLRGMLREAVENTAKLPTGAKS